VYGRAPRNIGRNEKVSPLAHEVIAIESLRGCDFDVAFELIKYSSESDQLKSFRARALITITKIAPVVK